MNNVSKISIFALNILSALIALGKEELNVYHSETFRCEIYLSPSPLASFIFMKVIKRDSRRRLTDRRETAAETFLGEIRSTEQIFEGSLSLSLSSVFACSSPRLRYPLHSETRSPDTTKLGRLSFQAFTSIQGVARLGRE